MEKGGVELTDVDQEVALLRRIQKKSAKILRTRQEREEKCSDDASVEKTQPARTVQRASDP